MSLRWQLLGDITNQSKDVLKLPEPRQPKMTTQGTTMIPKHISREEIIRFLEKKQKVTREGKKAIKLDREQKKTAKGRREERENRKRKADS